MNFEVQETLSRQEMLNQLIEATDTELADFSKTLPTPQTPDLDPEKEKKKELPGEIIKLLGDYYSDQKSFETDDWIGEKPDFSNPLWRNPLTYEAILRQDKQIYLDGKRLELYDIIPAQDFQKIIDQTKKYEYGTYVTMKEADKAKIASWLTVHQMTVGQLLGSYYYNRDFLGKVMTFESWR